MHRRLNNYLSVVVVALGLYLTLGPLMPDITFWLRHKSYQQILQRNASAVNKYHDNHLVIPVAGIDEKILEGNTLATADKGPWHRPASSSPDQGGNTVIVGHRYGPYRNTRYVFYNLDKIKMGDMVYIFWGHYKYSYKVISIKIVGPKDTSVESRTAESRVTLYTCTPLLTATHRLVVTAELEKRDHYD